MYPQTITSRRRYFCPPIKPPKPCAPGGVRRPEELRLAQLPLLVLAQPPQRRLDSTDAAVGAGRGGADSALGTVRGALEAAEALEAVLGVSGYPRLHALEATVDVLLARVQELSAGMYTHAHRYLPSR